jgi:hypothetical protein
MTSSFKCPVLYISLDWFKGKLTGHRDTPIFYGKNHGFL